MYLANKNKSLFFLSCLIVLNFLQNIKKCIFFYKVHNNTNTHIGKSHQYPYPYTLPANCCETLNCRWNVKYIPNEDMKTRFFSTRWAFSLGETFWLGSVHHSLGSEVGYRRKSLRYFRLWIQDSYYGQQLSLQTLKPLSSGSSFPTMDGTRHPPALQEQSLNHWSAREVWTPF